MTDMQHGGTDETSASSVEPVASIFTSARFVRRMTVAVIAMGLVLIVGFAALVGMIIYRSGKLKETANPARPASVQTIAPSTPFSTADLRRLYGIPPGVPIGTGLLPEGARITHVSIDGGRVMVAVEDAQGAMLLVYVRKTADRAWVLESALRLGVNRSSP